MVAMVMGCGSDQYSTAVLWLLWLWDMVVTSTVELCYDCYGYGMW